MGMCQSHIKLLSEKLFVCGCGEGRRGGRGSEGGRGESNFETEKRGRDSRNRFNKFKQINRQASHFTSPPAL